ncbi:shikimate dehydrogenase [uncultured Microbulbifer sp.]|uniref:shikimate dehydrogenase n=1 Tax=uncultured Microbulbifer sp. TaxID=348147 RepID=UPI0025E04BE2|nr:shikimate dehydrogenase [uncultured Microbulbifer sp.]
MTDLYAVVGNPIAQSRSPEIHAAFAAQTGQDIRYEKKYVELGQFAEQAQQFFGAGGRGLNVTVPFKLDAFEFADTLTERATTAGAVNTLALQPDGRILGDNTDGAGLVADLKNHLDWTIQGRSVLIVGAGGATRGALLPLLQEQPARLHIANRTAQKAQQLAQDFSEYGRITASGLDGVPDGFDLIINASAASLSGELPPLSPRALADGCRAYDMVYGAQPTPFMHWATGLGAEVSDGLGMLVGQAAESFYLWRGVRPQVAPVLSTLRERLQHTG